MKIGVAITLQKHSQTYFDVSFKPYSLSLSNFNNTTTSSKNFNNTLLPTFKDFYISKYSKFKKSALQNTKIPKYQNNINDKNYSPYFNLTISSPYLSESSISSPSTKVKRKEKIFSPPQFKNKNVVNIKTQKIENIRNLKFQNFDNSSKTSNSASKSPKKVKAKSSGRGSPPTNVVDEVPTLDVGK